MYLWTVRPVLPHLRSIFRFSHLARSKSSENHGCEGRMVMVFSVQLHDDPVIGCSGPSMWRHHGMARDSNSCCTSAILIVTHISDVDRYPKGDGLGWCILYSNRFWSEVRSCNTCSLSRVTTTSKLWPEWCIANDTFWVKWKDSYNESNFLDAGADGLGWALRPE
jgi:hypothetical protein